jgi:hypothetical protein
MSLTRFAKECHGLAGSLTRLYGDGVVAQISEDYSVAADLGGNLELAVPRAEGASFNPRIARVVSLVIHECESVSLALLRSAVYSCVDNERINELPSEVVYDVKEVKKAASHSPAWAQGVSLAITLDRVRHLHMMTSTHDEKCAYLDEVRASVLLRPESGAPERLRVKVLHAVDLQARRLADDRERGK